MATTIRGRRTKLDRWFGRCHTPGCTYRRVTDSFHVAGTTISYNGVNRASLIAHGLWCPEHNTWLRWEQLQGRFSAERECDARCMGAVGPSCDCQCGGENHGLSNI